jgi:N-sulfoglucosamine sulfohydrolase
MNHLYLKQQLKPDSMLMKFRGTLLSISGLLILSTFASFKKTEYQFTADPAKPNIIIIMADDLDSRQLSCYGGQNINTRNIDALAAEGMKFNNMIASEAMCVPTRASLFTGLFPARHGAFQNHKDVFTNLKSVGHYLADQGYSVGLTGKNHVTTPKSVFPFEIVKGFEPNCVSATDEYSLNEVRKYITRKDPYCLFVMSINPHTPWTVGDPSEFNADKLKLPEHWVDTKLTRTQFCKYLAEVRQLDNQVGDLMKMLKETGQDKNTIVIFLGEQGAQFPGAKWTLYDAGQKSSMIVRWPGQIAAGLQSNAIVQYEDVTPTLIDIAGGKAIQNLDGRSFLSVVQGKSQTHRDVAYGIHNSIPAGKAFPIRSIRDGQYKLILNLTSKNNYHIKYMSPGNKNSIWSTWLNKAATDSQAKMRTDRIVKHPDIEFYDLFKDPYEMNNLADKKEYQAMIKKYDSQLKQWMKQQGDPGAALDVPFKDSKSDDEL